MHICSLSRTFYPNATLISAHMRNVLLRNGTVKHNESISPLGGSHSSSSTVRYTVHPKKLPRTLPQATNKSKASKEHRHQKDTTPAKVVKCFFGDRTKEEAKSRSVPVGRKEKNATISKTGANAGDFPDLKKKGRCALFISPLQMATGWRALSLESWV